MCLFHYNHNVTLSHSLPQTSKTASPVISLITEAVDDFQSKTCSSMAIFWLTWFSSLEQNVNNPRLLWYTREEDYLLSHTDRFILEFQVVFFFKEFYFDPFSPRNPWVETQLCGCHKSIDFIIGKEVKMIHHLPMLPFPCIWKWAGNVTNKNQDLLFKLGFYIISVSLDLAFFIYMSWRLFNNNE